VSEQELIGQTIEDKYAILGFIGRGGMGMVYDAENLALGKRVAIKVLSQTSEHDAVALARFRQEARTAGSMGHPNVCEVYDLGELDDGRPFLVMERLTGETLRTLITREAPLPDDAVATVGAQVFGALAAAHRRGVVHRDVKPENVFLHKPAGDTVVIKILDFGVAKAVSRANVGDSDAVSLTDSGVVLGTPFYMAPEQATGGRIDSAVDVYAGCIVLYEALTGCRPFRAASHVEVVAEMLTQPPPRVTALRSNVDPRLDALIHAGLSRAPEDRPTAQTIRNELIAMLPESRAVTVQAVPSRVSFAPPAPPTSVRLDERFRQLAAAFGSFSADFSLAQADSTISAEESARLRGQLAELERWCRSMREDLGHAFAEADIPTNIDDQVPTLKR